LFKAFLNVAYLHREMDTVLVGGVVGEQMAGQCSDENDCGVDDTRTQYLTVELDTQRRLQRSTK